MGYNKGKFTVMSLMTLGAILGSAGSVTAADGQSDTAMASKLLSATLGMTSTSGTGDAALLFYLRPDINVGPLGMGLDLTIKTDVNGMSFPKSFADSVRYISLGYKGLSPLYVRVGDLERSTLGTGILVNNYSNLTTEDFAKGHRRLGLDAAFDLPFAGLEYIAKNAPVIGDKAPGLKAYRVYIKPLPNVRVGYSKATDNSLSELTPIDASSLDTELYIGKAFVIPYVAVARFDDKGNGGTSGLGYSAGIRGDWNLTGLRFAYKTEARLLDSDFIPGIFDFSYESSGDTIGGAKDKAWSALTTAPANGTRTLGLMGQAQLMVPALGLSVLGQLEGTKPFQGNALSEIQGIAPKVVAEAKLSDKLAIPVAGGKVGLGARYEGVLSKETDSLGKLKATAAWKAPIGITLAFINTYTYTKDKPTVKSVSIEGGWSF